MDECSVKVYLPVVDCVGANCGDSEASCTNPVRGTTVQLVQWAGHTKQEKGLCVCLVLCPP